MTDFDALRRFVDSRDENALEREKLREELQKCQRPAYKSAGTWISTSSSLLVLIAAVIAFIDALQADVSNRITRAQSELKFRRQLVGSRSQLVEAEAALITARDQLAIATAQRDQALRDAEGYLREADEYEKDMLAQESEAERLESLVDKWTSRERAIQIIIRDAIPILQSEIAALEVSTRGNPQESAVAEIKRMCEEYAVNKKDE